MDVGLNKEDQVIYHPKIIRSLMRSELRKLTLLYLYDIYPLSSYPAEIARCINADSMNVIGALKGANTRYNVSSSLIKLGTVSIIEEDGLIFYKISDLGITIAEQLKTDC
jgi:predicted transcriptional regulator with HTH domain